MADPIEITASTLEALTEQYRAIAHNLANVSTAGYKRRCTSFVQHLQALAGPGVVSSDAASATIGTVVGVTSVDFTQGALVSTGRPLDLALNGKGFFVLETPEGPLYTRSGVFRTNQNGQLVDAAGRTVAGEGGPIVIPSSVSMLTVGVSTDGAVSADGTGIGKLRVVEFEDESALIPAGGNAFLAPATETPTPSAGTAVKQRFQEAANVTPVQELVGLIAVTRMYEANLKAIQVQDERMKELLQVAMA